MHSGHLVTVSFRGIAQLVERAVWDREVGGSSPLSPTSLLQSANFYLLVSLLKLY